MTIKNVTAIAILYGLITAGANLIGVLMPNIFHNDDFTNPAITEWIQFLSEFKVIDNSQYISFLLPVFLCVAYLAFAGKKFESHFINLPIAFSTIGISGWIFYFLEELLIILYSLNKGYNLNVSFIIKSSLLNVLIESLVTFTFSFFIIDTIHKRYVLPTFFSEGHLYQFSGTKRPSIMFLFIINYISVTLFPVIILLTLLYSLSIHYNFTINSLTYNLLVIPLIFGIIITMALFNYFSIPLKKIKDRIIKIKEGDYQSKIKFVSNDSFGELCDTMDEMTEAINEQTQKIIEIQNSIITGMATMVESRDNSTGGHIKRTSDCVRIFSDHLKTVDEYKDISDSFFNAVIKAAPMHDLGKIAVDDSILRKPGKFTDEEYEKMKAHSAEGARIVENVLSSVDDIEFKNIAINVAHYHHEKWNGQGYPEKICNTEIPLEARIMALADVFDALVSKRCYKESFTYDRAFQIISEDLGTHFDPKLGSEFLKCRPALEKLYNEY